MDATATTVSRGLPAGIGTPLEALVPESPVYSGRLFRCLWDFVLEEGADIGRFFDGIDVPRKRLFQEDEWFSAVLAHQAWQNCRACLPGFTEADAFRTGCAMVRGNGLGALKTYLLLQPFPKVLRHLDEIQTAYSRIDALRCVDMGKTRALVAYRRHPAFRGRYLDGGQEALVRGYLSALPTLYGAPPAKVRQFCSSIDIFERFPAGVNRLGPLTQGRDGFLYLGGRRAARWIRIGPDAPVDPAVKRHLNGASAVLWELDCHADDGTGRRIRVASRGDLYNLPEAVFGLEWVRTPPFRRWRRAASAGAGYLKAFFRSKQELLRRMQGVQERSEELELRIRERTAALEESNRRLRSEIEERRTLEARLWASLKEKDLMLREVHHRVKNNLQVISSLMDMGARRAGDGSAADVLKDVRTKVQTLAMVHTGLVQTARLSAIEMEAQLEDLFRYLAPLYGRSGGIRFSTTSHGTRLPMAVAMPCALIANEWISNALKHAFRGCQQGCIAMGFHRTEGWVEMRYADDGCGLPDHVDIHAADSLGLKLVRIMATIQLKGELERLPEAGCSYRIRFPLEAVDADDSGHSAG